MVKLILIKSPDEWATTKQVYRDELLVDLFFPLHNQEKLCQEPSFHFFSSGYQLCVVGFLIKQLFYSGFFTVKLARESIHKEVLELRKRDCNYVNSLN